MRFKFFSSFVALVLVFSACENDFLKQEVAGNFAGPSISEGPSIEKQADNWYATVPSAGTITVKDNKKEFSYTFDEAGTFFIGKQSGYTGQLKFVEFIPARVYFTVTFYKLDGVTEVHSQQVLKGGYIDGSIPELYNSWADGALKASYGLAKNQEAIPYTLVDLDTGDEFIWQFTPDRPWEALAITKDMRVTVAVVTTSAKTSAEWAADIKAALDALVGDGSILDIVVSYGNNNSAIFLEIDGEEYIFIGGNDAGSDKYCTIDGVRYQINIYGNPKIYRVLVN